MTWWGANTMPGVNNKNGNGAPTPNGAEREVFRPPWVKETGPPPLPMPSAPWVSSKRNSITNQESQDPHSFQKPILKKVAPPVEKPINPQSNGTDPPEPAPIKKLKPILKKQQNSFATEPPKEAAVPVKRATENAAAPKPAPAKPVPAKPVPAKPVPPPPPAQNKTGPPPPPPMMNMPPPPPPPGGAPIETKPLSEQQKKRIEQLKSRPRRRPDWSDMMKEVEEGKKLRHVQCNDRSAPIISVVKKEKDEKGTQQFVFESEKKDVDENHNALLSEIQQGVRLKKVKTNDRSRPNLSGLRKFRRQMTVDEKIQKSMSMADVVAAAVEPDELDDIDKVRDDLQSAKQMLALELRNKETLERENKKMAAKVAALEAELEKEKQLRTQDAGTKIVKMKTDEDERVIKQLKEAAEESDRAHKEMEERYKASAEELDNTRRKLESAWLLNQELENQLKSVTQHAQHSGSMIPIMKQPSRKLVMQNTLHGKSIEILSSSEEEDSEDEETETESDEESDTAEDAEAKEQKRQTRELKLLNNKLRTYRDKHQRAQKERKSLRLDVKAQQRLLKAEKKKYKVLQKEVDKMAKLMKDNEGDEEEEEEEHEEVPEEESESESETESSSDSDSEEELPATATFEAKQAQLSNRAKKHEARLNSLKKGNYLLKANIDRLQDDLIRQRDMSLQLQEDLDSVLNELG